MPTQKTSSFHEIRDWFRSAVAANASWREAALEDIEFYAGEQWDEASREALNKAKRPAITINHIRPLINLLSGYQRLNRYEPDFLPRTGDDVEKCNVAKGITKYLFDTNEFDYEESRVALDAFLTGLGWFYLSYRDGEICFKRVSPFNVYPDPESREEDLSDAECIHYARWTSKRTLKRHFPDHADVIELVVARYDADEGGDHLGEDSLWYSAETKKVRLISTWYRSFREEKICSFPPELQLPDTPFEEVPPELRELARIRTESREEIRVASHIGDLLLEDVPSPYSHGKLPYIMVPAYWLGEGDTPAGVVRDLKDPQREMNKRRSQLLHIINTMANRGWLVKKGGLDYANKTKLEKQGSTPGVVIEYNETGSAPAPFSTDTIPSGFFQVDKQYQEDLQNISGINEAMLGTNVPASASGRALELRQRQAVTSLAMLFDKLRMAKKRLLKQLWGDPKHPGLLPQFYREPRVFRIVGESGQPDFVPVNQPQETVDPRTGMAVQQILNDLSTFEFDVVISDTPATPSQRVAAFYALLEMAKAGLPVPPDVIIEASDLPQKEMLKERLMQQQQMEMQARQQQSQGMPPGQPGAPPMGPPSPNLPDILAGARGG
jgi:hypothetical protein